MIMQTNIVGGEITKQNLTHIDQDASVLEASKLMRKSGMAEILITDERNGLLLPLGIVTANDIVTRVIALGLDPAVMTTGDIAWPGVTVSDTADGDTDTSQHISAAARCWPEWMKMSSSSVLGS